MVAGSDIEQIHIPVLLEETLEFAGILVFLYALFDRLSVLDAGNSIAPAKGTSLSTTEPQNGRS